MATWAMTLFAAFAADLYGATHQGQFANEQLCRLLGASPRVVEKQQQGVIAAPLGGSALPRGQQRGHLRFVQIGDDCLAGLLERDRADLAAPGNVLGTVLPHEARQRVNCGANC